MTKKMKASDIVTRRPRATESKGRATEELRAEPEQTPTPELTPIQEQLADLVGDLILRGGHTDEVDSIVWAAMTHHWRQRFDIERKNWSLDEKLTEDANTFARNNFERWKQRLIRSWPDVDERKAEPAAATSKTVTEYIRENYRGTLVERFEEFMSMATTEEIRFLDGVLMDHWSCSTNSIDAGELEIANSFEREIDRGVRWVRVPREYRDKVVSFVELLTKPIKAA